MIKKEKLNNNLWDLEPVELREKLAELSSVMASGQQSPWSSPAHNFSASSVYSVKGARNAIRERFVVFFGFNGLLKFRYAIVEGSLEPIHARMAMLEKPYTYKVFEFNEFQGIKDGIGENFLEIKFEDALSILRVGVQEKVDDFEDAEVDEFDKNCLETCKPGEHSCGK